jgi:hypothetical protein
MAGYLAEYQRHSREEAFRLPDKARRGIRLRRGRVGGMGRCFVQLTIFRMDDLATTATHPRPGNVHRGSDFVQTTK